MKIRYYMEQHKGQYLVKSKIGGQVFGTHDTQDAALEQIVWLDSLGLAQPRAIARKMLYNSTKFQIEQECLVRNEQFDLEKFNSHFEEMIKTEAGQLLIEKLIVDMETV
jgi:hypothetical protein